MKKWTAAALAALTALTLTGCSFQDVMLYLYGGDSFVTSRTTPPATATTA